MEGSVGSQLDKNVKERALDVYKEKNRKIKRCIYQSKKQFLRKMNQDVNGNWKLFWKEERCRIAAE